MRKYGPQLRISGTHTKSHYDEYGYLEYRSDDIFIPDETAKPGYRTVELPTSPEASIPLDRGNDFCILIEKTFYPLWIK